MRENGHNNHHMHIEVLEASQEEVTRDLVGRVSGSSPAFRRMVAVLALLFLLGVVAFVVRAVSFGFTDRWPWAYLGAVMGFLITTAGGAPIVAVALRAVRSHWHRPIARIAQIYAVAGLLTLLVFIPLILVLPPTDGRNTVWIIWHGRAPHIYNTLAVVALVVLGLALVYMDAVPDLATQAQYLGGWRGALARRLSSWWRGTSQQWAFHRASLSVLGGLYFIHLVFTHFLVSTDLAMSYVPGWRDSIFPPWHALTALQAGGATVIVTAYVLRRWGGYRRYITLNQFWSMSKILLALSLLWMYFWFSGFIVYWYGRNPAEVAVIRYLQVETYRLPFLLALFGNFIVPFLVLLWNSVRKSVLGPTIASVSILIGTLFDRIRIYVGAMGVDNIYAHRLESLPTAVLPDWVDILLVVGGISGALLLVALASKLVSPVSIWETTEGLLYIRVKRLLKGRYALMGKPR